MPQASLAVRPSVRARETLYSPVSGKKSESGNQWTSSAVHAGLLHITYTVTDSPTEVLTTLTNTYEEGVACLKAQTVGRQRKEREEREVRKQRAEGGNSSALPGCCFS